MKDKTIEAKTKNFKGKRNTNGFGTNKQNINRNGRPKKGIVLINHQLQKEGYEPACKQDIETAYMQIVNLDEAYLKKLIDDKKQPMLIRIIIKNMLGGKGFDVIERMLDRGIGKAMQKTELTGELGINNVLGEYSTKELVELLEKKD